MGFLDGGRQLGHRSHAGAADGKGDVGTGDFRGDGAGIDAARRQQGGTQPLRLGIGMVLLTGATAKVGSAGVKKIREAFRAAFLTIGCFTTAGMLFAWWLPVRRI